MKNEYENLTTEQKMAVERAVLDMDTPKTMEEIIDMLAKTVRGDIRKKERAKAGKSCRSVNVFNTIYKYQKDSGTKGTYLGIVKTKKRIYSKDSQRVLTGSMGRSVLLIPTFNLRYLR